MDSFIAALPKVELHVHLVGSASVPTVLELAKRHPAQGVPTTEEKLRELYAFRDFRHFVKVYAAVNGLIREPEDVATLVLGAARDLAAQNVRYFELTVTPYAHVVQGIPSTALAEALDSAAATAKSEHGIHVAYIFDIWGERGVEAAEATLEAALQHPPANLVGFGIAGIEEERKPYIDAFRDAFRAAIAAGLHSVPHAGETTGPETIWEAINGLGAERIGHGISCISDPLLVDHLRETQIPLEVCPTSNIRTGQVARIEEHPLSRMLWEGLFVTLNSDDPPMFATSLTNEYRVAAEAFGLDARQVAGLAKNAARASFMPRAEKQELLAEIDSVTNMVQADNSD